MLPKGVGKETEKPCSKKEAHGGTTSQPAGRQGNKKVGGGEGSIANFSRLFGLSFCVGLGWWSPIKLSPPLSLFLPAYFPRGDVGGAVAAHHSGDRGKCFRFGRVGAPDIDP